MRRLILALCLAAFPVTVLADDAPGTPAEKAVTTKPPESKPKKLGSFKEFGDELSKVGKNIGKGTVDAAKSGSSKVSSDVKNKKFKPKPVPDAQPPRSDRAGTP